jgi:hypothetical protein
MAAKLVLAVSWEFSQAPGLGDLSSLSTWASSQASWASSHCQNQSSYVSLNKSISALDTAPKITSTIVRTCPESRQGNLHFTSQGKKVEVTLQEAPVGVGETMLPSSLRRESSTVSNFLSRSSLSLVKFLNRNGLSAELSTLSHSSICLYLTTYRC